MARRDRLWPARWDKKILFDPIIRRLERPWCEDFSVAAKGSYHKHSLHVPGLTYIQLQGTVITLGDVAVARRYLQAFMEHCQAELQCDVTYLEEQLKACELLTTLDTRLAELEKSRKTKPPKS